MINLTKLKAINSMLFAIGEAPVSASELTQGRFSYASQAESTLDEVLLKVLKGGWNFNVREAVSLSPDINKHISLPPGAIKAYSKECNKVYLINPDGNLFDPMTQTDEFESSVLLDITFSYDYNVLPADLQLLILPKAKLKFRQDVKGTNPSKDSTLRREIAEARADAETWDSKVMQHKMTDNVGHKYLLNRNVRRR